MPNKNQLCDTLTNKGPEYIITEKIESLLNKFDLNFKRIGQPLRLLITGKINGPSITKIMDLLVLAIIQYP